MAHLPEGVTLRTDETITGPNPVNAERTYGFDFYAVRNTDVKVETRPATGDPVQVPEISYVVRFAPGNFGGRIIFDDSFPLTPGDTYRIYRDSVAEDPGGFDQPGFAQAAAVAALARRTTVALQELVARQETHAEIIVEREHLKEFAIAGQRAIAITDTNFTVKDYALGGGRSIALGDTDFADDVQRAFVVGRSAWDAPNDRLTLETNDGRTLVVDLSGLRTAEYTDAQAEAVVQGIVGPLRTELDNRIDELESLAEDFQDDTVLATNAQINSGRPTARGTWYPIPLTATVPAATTSARLAVRIKATGINDGYIQFHLSDLDPAGTAKQFSNAGGSQHDNNMYQVRLDSSRNLEFESDTSDRYTADVTVTEPDATPRVKIDGSTIVRNAQGELESTAMGGGATRTDAQVQELARDAVGAALTAGDATGDLEWTADDPQDELHAVVRDGALDLDNMEKDSSDTSRIKDAAMWRTALDVDEAGTGGGTTDHLPDIDPLPAVADYTLGDVIAHADTTWALVAGTTDPHVYHGTVAALASSWYGDATFAWRTSPSTGLRASLLRSVLGGTAPPDLYIRFHRGREYGESHLLHSSAADTATHYGYVHAPGEPGFEASASIVGQAFDVAFFDDAGYTSEQAVVANTNRWVRTIGASGPGGGGAAEPATSWKVEAVRSAVVSHTINTDGWTTWQTLASTPALTAAQVGEAIVAGHTHVVATDAVTAGGDRIFTESRIVRRRGNEVLTDELDYIRNFDVSGRADYNAAIKAGDANLHAFDTAQAGDVYDLQVRMVAQAATSSDTRTVTFNTEGNNLYVVSRSGTKGDKGDRGDPGISGLVPTQFVAVSPTLTNVDSTTDHYTNAVLLDPGVDLDDAPYSGHGEFHISAEIVASVASGGPDPNFGFEQKANQTAEDRTARISNILFASALRGATQGRTGGLEISRTAVYSLNTLLGYFELRLIRDVANNAVGVIGHWDTSGGNTRSFTFTTTVRVSWLSSDAPGPGLDTAAVDARLRLAANAAERTAYGVVQLARPSDRAAGTDDHRAMTPAQTRRMVDDSIPAERILRENSTINLQLANIEPTSTNATQVAAADAFAVSTADDGKTLLLAVGLSTSSTGDDVPRHAELSMRSGDWRTRASQALSLGTTSYRWQALVHNAGGIGETIHLFWDKGPQGRLMFRAYLQVTATVSGVTGYLRTRADPARNARLRYLRVRFPAA